MPTALLALALQAASPLPITPAPSIPMSPEVADARCVAAFGFLASRNGKEADSIGLGAIYFYGKLIGRDPTFDLAASLPAVVMTNPADLQSEVRRCGRELAKAGGAMTAAGAALMRSATP